MEKASEKYLIWDWNGTLIDDVDASVRVMNLLLRKRGMELITKAHYLEVFDFPVKNYYQRVGFDLKYEQFEELAVEYIDSYLIELQHVKLFEGALDVLKKFKNKGYTQILLSAMEQNSLLRNLIYLKADASFDDVFGSFDMEAYGKIDVAQEVKEDYELTPKNALLVGDTLHDKEIADELGVSCILLSTGHQSRARIEKAGVPIVDTLQELAQKVDEFFTS